MIICRCGRKRWVVVSALSKHFPTSTNWLPLSEPTPGKSTVFYGQVQPGRSFPGVSPKNPYHLFPLFLFLHFSRPYFSTPSTEPNFLTIFSPFSFFLFFFFFFKSIKKFQAFVCSLTYRHKTCFKETSFFFF